MKTATEDVGAGNGLALTREAERRKANLRSLAEKLRDNVTVRALGNGPRDRESRNRLTGLWDAVYDTRNEIAAWAEAESGR
jgi:hypothetical protein